MQTQLHDLVIFGILEPRTVADNGPSTFTVVVLVLLLILCAVFTLWLLRAGFYKVPEGAVAVVERFGRFARLAGPGPVWVTPCCEQIKHIVPVRLKEEQYTVRNLWFRDVVQVDVDLTICYRLDLSRVEPSLLRDLVYRSPDPWRTRVENHAAWILRDLISQYDLMELLGPDPAYRKDTERAFVQRLEEELGEWGVRLDQPGGAWLRDVRPTAALEQALNNIRRTDVDIKTKSAILDTIRQRYPELSEVVLLSLFNTISGEGTESIQFVPHILAEFSSSQTPQQETGHKVEEEENGRHLPEGNGDDSWRSLRALPAIDTPDSESDCSDGTEGPDEIVDSSSAA